jgi:hypothetical protein
VIFSLSAAFGRSSRILLAITAIHIPSSWMAYGVPLAVKQGGGLWEILAEALATGNIPHNYSVNRHFVTTAISIWVSLGSAACSAHAARMPKPDPLGVRPKRA